MAELPGGQNAEEGRDSLASLPVGTMLRGYEIASVLGEGAFGITYLARDATLGREVAIKEYLPSELAVRRGDSTVVPRSTAAADDFIWGRDRFLEEARTLARLEGVPGVIRVIDYLEANGTAYMVMALARGETLQQRIKTAGPLSPLEVDRILWPLLEGLEQVHATGYLHRDIKPSNIILDARGLPILIDFGASRAAMLDRTSADMTAVFTPGYAAAEQFVSTKQGPWTDIYGLSATLYHAIAGTQPPSAIGRILDDDYKPLAQLAPAGFAPGILGGIDAGMTVRSADRPQSIAAWRELLKQQPAAREDTVLVHRSEPETPAIAASLPPAVVSPPPATRSSRKRPAVWLGLAVAIVVLAGGGYFVNAAIEEQRNAEAAVVAARKQAEDSRRQAEIDAQGKTDTARAAATQLERRKAEEAAAKLKAETEARLKAEEARRQQAAAAAAAAAAQKAQEETARKDREAAEAVAKRQVDEESARKRTALDEESRKQAEKAVAPFDSAMRDWMAQYEVKQASIAVLREDRLVFTRGYNGRNVDDRINLWSLSAAITAVCVAMLIDEGKLQIDAKLGGVLQALYARHGTPADPRVSDISIEDLLTHRSGWPQRFGDNSVAPGFRQLLQRTPLASATADMVMPQLLAFPLTRPPGERYEHSLANYLMLGQVIEAVSGEPYAEGCAKRVLATAGISRPQLDPPWGRALQSAAGWSLSGPEYLAFLRLYRVRQPDVLGAERRRWLWDGERKWTSTRKDRAFSLGVWTRPADRSLWSWGSWNWRQADAKGGPIAVKQGIYTALASDGTGWVASFDTVNFDPDPKPMEALEKALWNARKEVKSWPDTDGFGERGIRPVSVGQAGGRAR